MTAVAQVVAKAEMLIRRPIAEVFEAFVDPAITARFWFSRGDAASKPGNGCAGTGTCTGFPRKSK